MNCHLNFVKASITGNDHTIVFYKKRVCFKNMGFYWWGGGRGLVGIRSTSISPKGYLIVILTNFYWCFILFIAYTSDYKISVC